MINDLVINVETSSPSDVSCVSLLLQIIPSIFSYRLVRHLMLLRWICWAEVEACKFIPT